jgi:hypothetical protein
MRARREGRSFGLGVGGVLALLAAWWLYRGKFPSVASWALGIGLLLVVLGLAAPALLSGPARAWLLVGEALSFVMTRVILAIVFYLVLTPLGLLRHLLGGDPLGRKLGGATYWRPYPARQRDPHHYEKMY